LRVRITICDARMSANSNSLVYTIINLKKKYKIKLNKLTINLYILLTKILITIKIIKKLNKQIKYNKIVQQFLLI